MNQVRIGRSIRALRRRRGWRQIDLARRAVCSQQAVSLAGRGGSHLSLRTLQRIATVLEAELELTLRSRGAQLDRLLDEAHATIVGAAVRRLERHGWLVRVEVTYGVGSRDGPIDLLGFEPRSSSLLVIEVKSEIVSVEATIRKLDEKSRVGPEVAAARFGWQATSVSRMLVLPRSATSWRAIDRHRAVFDRALPDRGAPLSAWLRSPTGAVSGILTVPITKLSGVRTGVGGAQRVRAPGTPLRVLAPQPRDRCGRRIRGRPSPSTSRFGN